VNRRVRIVFVHQNFPGQFGRLASALAEEGHEVLALSIMRDRSVPGVRIVHYEPDPGPDPAAFDGRFSDTVARLRRAYGIARRAKALSEEGFHPDIVVANTGWGENLFLKDVWPRARHIAYFEYFYAADGQDVGFDPEFPLRSEEVIWRLRIKNMQQLAAFDVADAAVAPTRWQRDTFPAYLRSRMTVIHDGIDTQLVRPDPTAAVRFGENGPRFDRTSPVVTYVTRNIEPMRGSHILFRSLPGLLALDPKLRVVVLGGAGVSYGSGPNGGKTWAEIFKAEVESRVDWSRVFFMGSLPHAHFVRVLQVSAAHLYLSYPFVLSWSLIEAMSAQCRLAVSDTTSIAEAVRHNDNGLVFPFFEPDALVERVKRILSRPEEAVARAARARKDAVERYDFRNVCLPRWRTLLGVA
jgi:glycosyltransferase involved in cell wall biosynthesis